MANYKKIKVNYSGLEKYKKELFDAAVKNKTEYLIKYAKETLKKAYEESTFEDQTYNLRDSYLWAVYFNGNMVESGFIDNSPKASEPQFEKNEVIWGRSDAESFLSAYNPRITNGWEVMFAAAVIYGMYLEEGERGNPRRQFVVLSSIFNQVEQDFGKQNTQIFKEVI